MKLKCPRKVLVNNFQSVASVVPLRPTHPVLANVLIRANKGEQAFYMTGFDLSIGSTIRVEAEILDEGEVTVPAKLFGSIVSKLPDGDVAVGCDVDDDSFQVQIKSSSGRYKVMGLHPGDYPVLPTVKSDNFILENKNIIKSLSTVLFAASSDETKQILTGINVQTSGNKITFAATDGHRLSICSVELDTDTKLPGINLTIPAAAMRELIKLIKDSSQDNFSMMHANSQVLFQTDTRKLYTRVLEGQYPAYSQLLPNKFTGKITVNRDQLYRAAERVAILAEQKNNILKCEFNQENKELIFSVETADVGSGKESLPFEFTGSMPEAIAFNTKYLLEGLKAMSPAEEVFISINSANTPVVIEPSGELIAKYLIMPVQLRS